jgi:hypothetical protein
MSSFDGVSPGAQSVVISKCVIHSEKKENYLDDLLAIKQCLLSICEVVVSNIKLKYRIVSAHVIFYSSSIAYI